MSSFGRDLFSSSRFLIRFFRAWIFRLEEHPAPEGRKCREDFSIWLYHIITVEQEGDTAHEQLE